MENLLQTVREERSRYGAVMGHDECARLCNAVAWRHRAQGFGVSAKASGTFGTLPNGVKIAHDILHHLPSNELVDILTAAGAESVPQWAPVGPPQSPDRVFVAPVDPQSWVSSPTPAPTNPPAPAGPTLADVMQNLAALQNAIDTLTTQTRETADAVARLESALKRGVPVRMSLPLVGRVTGTVGGA